MKRVDVAFRTYVLKRLALLIAALWAFATLVFLATYVLPGFNQASEAVRRSVLVSATNEAELEQGIALLESRHGLDEPLYAQYARYLGEIATLNLGSSLSYYPTTVGDAFGDVLGWSLLMLGVWLIVSFLAATVSGFLLGFGFSFRLLQPARRLVAKFTPIPHILLTVVFVVVLFYALGWCVGLSDDFTLSRTGKNMRAPMELILQLGDPIPGTSAWAARIALAVAIAQFGLWILGSKGFSFHTGSRDFTEWSRQSDIGNGVSFGRFPMRGGGFARLALALVACLFFVEGSTYVESVIGNPGLGNFYHQASLIGDVFMVAGAEIVVGSLVISMAVGYDVISAWVGSRRKAEADGVQQT